MAECSLGDDILTVSSLRLLNGDRSGDFTAFEDFLQTPGPWVAGLDFPFGQPRALVDALGWPADSWSSYVGHVRAIGKAKFERELLDYAKSQPAGKKLLRRRADELSMSISPMMLHYTPVAKMFFEGAPRLQQAPVSIPPVRPLAGVGATVLEAYPRLVVNRWIARTSYKAEGKTTGDRARRQARQTLLDAIQGRPSGHDEHVKATYGCVVAMSGAIEARCVADDSGDCLDSVLCALQAAWAASRSARDFGIPGGVDPLEGWIADPLLG